MTKNYELQPEMSVTIERWLNRTKEEPFVHEIRDALRDLKSALPSLPSNISLYFDTREFSDGVGITGYARTATSIGVCVNPDFSDTAKQSREIKPFVFHEGYHIVDGFHYDAGKFSGIESAVAEGKAVVFEMQYADSRPGYANWQDEEEKLASWYEQLKRIDAEQYYEESGETWQKWAFWDKETGESWRVYKVGTWIIQKVTEARGMDVKELHGTAAAQIIKWFEEINHATHS